MFGDCEARRLLRERLAPVVGRARSARSVVCRSGRWAIRLWS